MKGKPAYIDEYSTSEIIQELERQADQLQIEREGRDPLVDCLRTGAVRLRQYQIIDRQRLVSAMSTVKRISGG